MSKVFDTEITCEECKLRILEDYIELHYPSLGSPSELHPECVDIHISNSCLKKEVYRPRLIKYSYLRRTRGYIDNQLWSECQLVTLNNIHRYFNGQFIAEQGSPLYEALAEKYCCKNGACLRLPKLWDALGYVFPDYSSDKIIDPDTIPLTCAVKHKKHGVHGVAVVGYKKEAGIEYLLVPNFSSETKHSWIEKAQFESFLFPMRHAGEDRDRWCQRQVRIIASIKGCRCEKAIVCDHGVGEPFGICKCPRRTEGKHPFHCGTMEKGECGGMG